MFQSDSRYATLETVELELSDGRVVRHVRRRFLPRGEQLETLAEVTVTQGDRLDLIAHRTLGNATVWWRICDANDASDPQTLVDPGRRLVVPIPRA